MLLEQIYSFLSINHKPSRCDCIFVFAGKHERKVYGLDLYHKGLSPNIIFSVGRFEWRKFLMFNFSINREFQELVDSIPYYLRHFFVEIKADNNNTCLAVEKQKYGTLSEIIALLPLIKQRKYRRILIISSAFHLRRINFVMNNLIGDHNIELISVPVPESLSSIKKQNWWNCKEGLKLVFSEYFKLILYFFLIPFYKMKLEYF